MRIKYPHLLIVAVLVLSMGVFPVSGFSQAVFYQGKTLKIINNDPGGALVEPLPDPALQSYARRRQGIPHPMIAYFASVPWMARAVIDMHREYGLLMHLDQTVADLVVLVVSQENSCRFCYAAVRGLLWAQGMSWARIQRMEQDLSRADLPPPSAAAPSAEEAGDR